MGHMNTIQYFIYLGMHAVTQVSHHYLLDILHIPTYTSHVNVPILL